LPKRELPLEIRNALLLLRILSSKPLILFAKAFKLSRVAFGVLTFVT
jgi:hypothetical protein